MNCPNCGSTNVETIGDTFSDPNDWFDCMIIWWCNTCSRKFED